MFNFVTLLDHKCRRNVFWLQFVMHTFEKGSWRQDEGELQTEPYYVPRSHYLNLSLCLDNCQRLSETKNGTIKLSLMKPISVYSNLSRWQKGVWVQSSSIWPITSVFWEITGLSQHEFIFTFLCWLCCCYLSLSYLNVIRLVTIHVIRD